MKKSYIRIYLLFYISGTLSQNTEMDFVALPCTTPNGDEAYCLPLNKCQKLNNQVDNEDAQAFLAASQCGKKNSSLLFVCCGNHSNYITSTNVLSLLRKVKIENVTKDDVLPKDCGRQKLRISTKIIGGNEAELGESPWMARLYYKKSRNEKVFGCGGFLITPRFVLTAAHCMWLTNRFKDPVVEVQLGEHNILTSIDCNNEICANKPQTIRVQKRIVHPNYNRTNNNLHDIALIYLQEAAELTTYTFPICLVENSETDLKSEYSISGWGKTESGELLSPVKKTATIPYVPLSDCAKKYKEIDIMISNNQICAGGEISEDSCTGDSGGPLMVYQDEKWFAAGLVSFGWGCGKPGWPGIYTNVTSYLSWIKKKISKIIRNEANKQLENFQNNNFIFTSK